MAAAAILFLHKWLPFRCYLSDHHQILHRDASNTATCCKIPKPEVEVEIQDGGGGHLDFLKTQ
jgi:hypothetical protein